MDESNFLFWAHSSLGMPIKSLVQSGRSVNVTSSPLKLEYGQSHSISNIMSRCSTVVEEYHKSCLLWSLYCLKLRTLPLSTRCPGLRHVYLMSKSFLAWTVSPETLWVINNHMGNILPKDGQQFFPLGVLSGVQGLESLLDKAVNQLVSALCLSWLSGMGLAFSTAACFHWEEPKSASNSLLGLHSSDCSSQEPLFWLKHYQLWKCSHRVQRNTTNAVIVVCQ